MRGRIHWAWSVALWLACLVPGISAAESTVPPPAPPQIGEVPPDWLGKTPRGEEIRVSDHRGKVVVVSFWASWCPYCRKQFPVLDYLQKQAGPERIRVVVVNFKEDAQTYRGVIRKLRESTVTWTHDRKGDISDAYAVSAVPRLFVIDKAGKLAHVRNGYSEESLPDLFAAINAFLAAPSPDEAPVLPDASPAPRQEEAVTGQ